MMCNDQAVRAGARRDPTAARASFASEHTAYGWPRRLAYGADAADSRHNPLSRRGATLIGKPFSSG